MEQEKQDAAGRYFAELSKCLHRQGFAVEPVTGGLLTAYWQDAVLCHFDEDGGIRYPKPADPERKAAVDRAYGITRMTAEYMKLMEQAPPLKAEGLEGDYRLLSEFNDTVLAGHPTKYGVQFITWDWTYGHTGLWQGHYHIERFQILCKKLCLGPLQVESAFPHTGYKVPFHARCALIDIEDRHLSFFASCGILLIYGQFTKKNREDYLCNLRTTKTESSFPA